MILADAPADEVEQADYMAMYRSHSGTWESVTTTRLIEADETLVFKGRWVQREILNGTMVEMKGYEEKEGETYEYMWLYGYDPREESYVGWFHDMRGLNSKFYGNWSERDKKMTWTLADAEEAGIMVTIVDDLSEPDELRFTFELEGDDGTLLMTQAGVATRVKDE
ncbi:MAG: DUF1579 family protein [Planctomycetota bacterium]